jgi:hypothetical protein
MYVDKQLSGIRAVQTLSRLNRAHPKKHGVFRARLMNDVDTLRAFGTPGPKMKSSATGGRTFHLRFGATDFA